MTLRRDERGRAMLLGGEAFHDPAPCLVEFRQLARERIEQAKEDWRAGRFPLVPGDEEEFIPLPDSPQDGELPMMRASQGSRFRPVSRMNVALAGPDDATAG